MALKSYSFKTREEALNLEKIVKELFKKKKHNNM
jgi:predicted GIY-YIG superfamily endonuclease